MSDPFLICVVAIIAFGVLGMPIGHSMIAGTVLYLLIAGMDVGTAAEQILNGMFTSFLLLAIPLFILAAEFMNSGSIMDRLLRFCNALVGRFRGGLAQVNVVQSIIFASMSGSALADVAGTGRLMQTLMAVKGGYTRSFTAALSATSAVIGPILPPSIPLVMFALVSDASVGYLFLAGVVPGLILGAVLIALIAYLARRRNFPVEPKVPLREIPGITWHAFPALMLPVILLGCLYSGITTPTEAAAVAAAYALFLSTVVYRSMSLRGLYESLLRSGRVSVSIGMLIAGALAFNYVVTVENIPRTVGAALVAAELSPIVFLLAVNVGLLALGCFLEATTIILIILPVLLPAAVALGIDPVHFGVVTVMNIMIGLVTPPYGLLLLMMSKIADIPLLSIVRELVPFLCALIFALALVTCLPDAVLYLPRLAGYTG